MYNVGICQMWQRGLKTNHNYVGVILVEYDTYFAYFGCLFPQNGTSVINCAGAVTTTRFLVEHNLAQIFTASGGVRWFGLLDSEIQCLMQSLKWIKGHQISCHK